MTDEVRIDATVEQAPYDEAALVPASPGARDLARGALTTMQQSFVLNVTAGKKAIPNVMGRAVMVHVGGGIVYFQPHKEKRYEVVEVAWEGPRYETRFVTEEQSSSRTKSGRKGRVAGAVVGTLLLPGVGTVLGAAVGTGKKSKTRGGARTESYQQQQEVPAPCRIVLEEQDTGREVSVVVGLTSDKAPDVLALIEDYERDEDKPEESQVAALVEPATASAPAVTDAYDELKKAKELLDMGILSQDEFDAKKRELLGL